MKQLTKTIVVCVPTRVVYDTLKKVDTVRSATDLSITAYPQYLKDIQNELLVSKVKNSFGKESTWEWNLQELTTKSCQITLKVEYDDRNDKRIQSHFETKMRLLTAIENSYRSGLLEHIRAT